MEMDTIVQMATVLVMIVSIVITAVWSIKQMRSNTYSRIMDRMFELNKIEFRNKELFKALDDPLDAREPFLPEKHHYLFMVFSIYNEIFMQHYSCGLLSEGEYISWERRFASLLVNKKSILEYWERFYKEDASDNFNKWVIKIMKDYKDNKKHK